MKKQKKTQDARAATPWKRSIDLHGMRVEEAVAELERFLNRCIMEEGVHKVEIIHGLGTGRVKAAVWAYLENLTVIEGFHLDTLNPGVTWVEL